MRQLQQQHHQARLADATADGLRHIAAQQRLVPLQLHALFITGQRQLMFQRGGVDADAHRGQLESVLQHRVPHHDIAVQARQPPAAGVVQSS